ncbi:FAD-dependent monooxygenase [Streptomyces monashensis]|uniref:FAD-dependent monooxygenase n=1 Tax=Streptomyces monashensis TaxID=1678012 RepID=UPI0033FE2735
MSADVIVVGGGPVGLLTAALLDAAGAGVEVYERSREFDRHTKGITVHPRTLEVLTTLEGGDGRRLGDVLVARGMRVRSAHYAALPARLDYSGLDTPFPFVLMVPQWQTREMLAEYLRERGVRVHYGVEVTDVAQSGEEVRIRAGDAPRTARYLVGADGARSIVRAAAGIDFPGSTPTMTGFVADVEATDPLDGVEYFWNDAGYVGYMRLGETSVRLFGAESADTGLTSQEVRRRQAEPFTLADLRTALTRICGRDFGVHSPSWLSRTGNSGRYAERYRAGRILLAGDAAHIHMPAAGQGLNVGLQDAANLAWKLAAEVHGWAPEALVTGEFGYDSERRPVADRLIADTLAQDALFHTFGRAAAALRATFSRFIERGGEVAAELTGWVSGLGVGYPCPAGAHPLVGTRAPDLALTSGSLMRALRADRFLLVDLTGDRAAGSALAHLGGARTQVVTARPVDAQDAVRGAAWHGVRAALIRPDGHVAHVSASAGRLSATGAEAEAETEAEAEAVDGAEARALAGAVAAWTGPDRRTAPSGDL